MEPALKDFVERVFSINPAASDVIGSGVPGMSGMSVTMLGSGSTVGDLIHSLHKSTGLFAEKAAARASRGELEALAKEVEGELLSLAVLGQISREFSESLIADLHTLTGDRG